MRNLTYIFRLALAVAATLTIGCQRDKTSTSAPKLLEFYITQNDDLDEGSVAMTSRADIRDEQFESSDNIGVLAYWLDEGEVWDASEHTDGASFIENDFLYYNSSYGWVLYNPKYWPENSTPSIRIFSYYPYDGDLSFNYPGGYPSFSYTLPNNGTEQGDFMVANPSELFDKDDEYITLNYKHQLARINFSVLQEGDKILYNSITSPATPYFSAVGTFSESDFLWSDYSNPLEIISEDSSSSYYIENDERYLEDATRVQLDEKYSVLLLPQTLRAGTEFTLNYSNVNLDTGAPQASQSASVTLAEDVELERGESYNIPFIIGNGEYFEEFNWVPFVFNATGESLFTDWDYKQSYVTAYGKVQNQSNLYDDDFMTLNNVLYTNNANYDTSYFEGDSSSTEVLVNTKYPGEQSYDVIIANQVNRLSTKSGTPTTFEIDLSTETAQEDYFVGGMLWGQSEVINPSTDITPEEIDIDFTQKMCKVTVSITMSGADYVFALFNVWKVYNSIKLKNTLSQADFDITTGEWGNFVRADIAAPSVVSASSNVLTLTFYTLPQVATAPIVEIIPSSGDVYSITLPSNTWVEGGTYTYSDSLIHTLIGRYYFSDNGGFVTSDYTKGNYTATPTSTAGLAGVVCEINNFFTPESGYAKIIGVMEVYKQFLSKLNIIPDLGDAKSSTDGLGNTSCIVDVSNSLLYSSYYSNFEIVAWIENLNKQEGRISSTKNESNYSSSTADVWYHPAIYELTPIYDILGTLNSYIEKLPSTFLYRNGSSYNSSYDSDTDKPINSLITGNTYWSSTVTYYTLINNQMGYRINFSDCSFTERLLDNEYRARPFMVVDIPSDWEDY